MELDINPEWPTLITYRHRQGLLPTKVVPNYQQPTTRYLVPDDRDFFAVYRRLPGWRPFRSNNGGGGAGRTNIESTTQEMKEQNLRRRMNPDGNAGA